MVDPIWLALPGVAFLTLFLIGPTAQILSLRLIFAKILMGAAAISPSWRRHIPLRSGHHGSTALRSHHGMLSGQAVQPSSDASAG